MCQLRRDHLPASRTEIAAFMFTPAAGKYFERDRPVLRNREPVVVHSSIFDSRLLITGAPEFLEAPRWLLFIYFGSRRPRRYRFESGPPRRPRPTGPDRAASQRAV